MHIPRSIKTTELFKNLLRIFLVTLPFQPVWILKERTLDGTKWQFGSLLLYSGELIIVLCVFLWIFQAWQEKKISINKKLPAWAIWLIIFIFYSLLSSTWSVYPDLAWQKTRLLTESILALIMIRFGPLTPKESLKWLLTGIIPAAVIGIYQFLSQSSFNFKWLGIINFETWQTGAPVIVNSGGRWLRAFGSFLNPNIFGGYLALTLMLLLKKTETINSKLYITLGILTTALFFSLSRSAWIALGIFILIYIAQIIKEKKYTNSKPIIFITILFFILGFIYTPLLQTRIKADSRNEKQSLEERASSYTQGLEVLKKNPLLGVGAGNYTAMTGQDLPVHNVFLLFLDELGVIGFVLAFIVLFLVFKASETSFIYLISLFPLLFLDHYLLSLWSGLVILASFLAIFLYPPHDTHCSSTDN